MGIPGYKPRVAEFDKKKTPTSKKQELLENYFKNKNKEGRVAKALESSKQKRLME